MFLILNVLFAMETQNDAAQKSEDEISSCLKDIEFQCNSINNHFLEKQNILKANINAKNIPDNLLNFFNKKRLDLLNEEEVQKQSFLEITNLYLQMLQYSDLGGVPELTQRNLSIFIDNFCYINFSSNELSELKKHDLQVSTNIKDYGVFNKKQFINQFASSDRTKVAKEENCYPDGLLIDLYKIKNDVHKEIFQIQTYAMQGDLTQTLLLRLQDIKDKSDKLLTPTDIIQENLQKIVDIYNQYKAEHPGSFIFADSCKQYNQYWKELNDLIKSHVQSADMFNENDPTVDLSILDNW